MEEVPVITIDRLGSDTSARAAIDHACREWGFFQIVGHGVPADVTGLSPQWPATLPGFEAAIRAYYQACEGIALRLLEAIATNLGAAPAALRRDFEPSHTSFLRLNYYPTCPAPARPAGIEVPDGGDLGINHHTDAGAVTLLLQDEQAPLASTVDAAHPARYRPVPWAEFRARRAAGDYADTGAEVQIADYRIEDS